MARLRRRGSRLADLARVAYAIVRSGHLGSSLRGLV
jgi:hypothetical protein